MNNYEYIISSLPAISLDWKFGEGASFDTYVGWIKSQLSGSDIKVVDRLLDGFKDENLNREFYEAAIKDNDRFVKEYFTFDLNVRNGKARFLNKAFERPLDQDTIRLETGEFAEGQRLEEALNAPDLLSRERGLDSLMWTRSMRSPRSTTSTLTPSSASSRDCTSSEGGSPSTRRPDAKCSAASWTRSGAPSRA